MREKEKEKSQSKKTLLPVIQLMSEPRTFPRRARTPIRSYFEVFFSV